MSITKHTIRSVVLTSSLFVLMLFPACEEKLRPSVTFDHVQGEIPGQESWNATITFTDSGKIKGILRAGHIAVFDQKKYTALDSNIVVDFYDDQERHTSVLTALRGRVDDITHNFEAHDHVVVISDSGTTLRTEALYWSNDTRKIHTPLYVEIISPKEQIRGQGFESDQSLKEYTIYKVTGKAKTDE